MNGYDEPQRSGHYWEQFCGGCNRRILGHDPDVVSAAMAAHRAEHRAEHPEWSRAAKTLESVQALGLHVADSYDANPNCKHCAKLRAAEVAQVIADNHAQSTEVNVTVDVDGGGVRRNWPRPVAVLLTIALVLWGYGWLAGVVTAVVAVIGVLCVLLMLGLLVWLACDWSNNRRARRAELLARCDQQHQQVIDGDPRGIYGVATEAMQAYWNELEEMRAR